MVTFIRSLASLGNIKHYMWTRGIGNTIGACVGLESWASVQIIQGNIYIAQLFYGDQTNAAFVIVPKDWISDRTERTIFKLSPSAG